MVLWIKYHNTKWPKSANSNEWIFVSASTWRWFLH